MNAGATISLVLTCLLASLATAAAATLPVPSGKVVLVVTGEIENTNKDGTAVFDIEMLEKLDGRTARMKTPWTEGDTEFSGPLLREVLEAVGASGSMLRFKALNDYEVGVPTEDALKLDTILATSMNGSRMSVRDKGPLFLVYPFDKRPDLYTERYFSRSIWQIEKFEVVR